MSQTNFNLTPQMAMELLGLKTRQRLYQLKQEHLKEGVHYIQIVNLTLYNQQAIDKLKEIRK
jgi:hypothetical protein